MINFDDFKKLNIFYGSKPEDLQEEDIDESIRGTIYRINRSDWVKTLWCCGGHFKDSNNKLSLPYLALIVESENLDKLVQMINDSTKRKRQLSMELEMFTQCNYCLYVNRFENCNYVGVNIYFEDKYSYKNQDNIVSVYYDQASNHIHEDLWWQEERHALAKLAKLIDTEVALKSPECSIIS